MMDYWLDGPAKKHADGGDRASAAKKPIDAFFKDTTLAALNANMIVRYTKDRYELQEKAPATVRKELQFTSQAFDLFIYVKDLKKSNPFIVANKIIRMERLLPPNGKREVRPTHAQFEQLINYTSARGIYTVMPLLIEFAALEGMRRAEIVRMRREHLTKGVLNIPTTKTGVPRNIVLFPRSIEILKSLPSQLDGSFWGLKNPNAVTWRFVTIKKALGIENLRFHDLRHEACSRMADMKMSILDISAKSGHADMNMLKRYVQLSPEDEAREYAINKAELNNRELLIKFGVAA